MGTICSKRCWRITAGTFWISHASVSWLCSVSVPTILPSNSVAKRLNVENSSRRERFFLCDSDWAIYYARRFLADLKINRKSSLGISMENFPVTLGKDLRCTFTLAHLGYKKGEREKKPGGEGQRFNICKCFYISWYKTHDSEWLPKCLNPVRHTKKWMIWAPSVCPFGTCGNGHLSDYLWIWKCIWNNEGPSALLSWQLPVTFVTLAAG